MRIENEQDLAEVFPDFSLADISNLFMGGKERREPEKVSTVHIAWVPAPASNYWLFQKNIAMLESLRNYIFYFIKLLLVEHNLLPNMFS